MSVKYLEFICTKDTFNGTFDAQVSVFDAYDNYAVLAEFYDGCPECETFPKEEYFSGGWYDRWVDYVIWEDGKIVARAGIWKNSDEAWEVAGVITRPECRSKGYSVRIVSHCAAKILEQGKTAILSTAETNIPMITAAKRAGFRIQEAD